jgi:hypothetical protein
VVQRGGSAGNNPGQKRRPLRRHNESLRRHIAQPFGVAPRHCITPLKPFRALHRSSTGKRPLHGYVDALYSLLAGLLDSFSNSPSSPSHERSGACRGTNRVADAKMERMNLRNLRSGFPRLRQSDRPPRCLLHHAVFSSFGMAPRRLAVYPGRGFGHRKTGAAAALRPGIDRARGGEPEDSFEEMMPWRR